MQRNKLFKITALASFLIVLVAASLFLTSEKYITGMAVLDDYSSQSNENSVRINFTEAGDFVFYLDLNNTNYSVCSLDVFSAGISNPSVDILADGTVDWDYKGEFSSLRTIDFKLIIENYLLNCFSYPCNVPFSVKSDSAGEIIFNNLVLEENILYENASERLKEEDNKEINKSFSENITEEISDNLTEKITEEINEDISENIVLEESLSENNLENETLGESERVFVSFDGLGDGSFDNPYNITNCTQLQDMELNLVANYSIINDINCENTSTWNDGAGFRPVGNYSETNPFNGTLRGNHYTISNLYINRTSKEGVGLIGYLEIESARFDNLTLNNINISGTNYIGGLIGFAYYSILDNIRVTGKINSGLDYIGLIAGEIMTNGNITNSYASGNIFAGDTPGGLVGYINGDIINCSVIANITSNNNEIGGLVGTADNMNIKNSSFIGTINTTSADGSTGGLIGYQSGDGSIYQSYAKVTIQAGGGNYIGGLAGRITDNIIDSYAEVKIIVLGSSEYVGGLVGWFAGGINNSYAVGSMEGIYPGTLNYTGGLAGQTGADNIYYSFSNVSIISYGKYNGSIAGNILWGAVINNTYFNNYSSIPPSCGKVTLGSISQCYAIQDNQTYFYNVSNPPMNFWNFTTIWDDVFNLTDYPPLRWQNATLPHAPTPAPTPDSTPTPITGSGSKRSGTTNKLNIIKECNELWTCSAWEPEQCDKVQERICTDINKCNTTEQKPVVVRLCPEEDNLIVLGGNNISAVNISASSVEELPSEIRYNLYGYITAAISAVFILFFIILLFIRRKDKPKKRREIRKRNIKKKN